MGRYLIRVEVPEEQFLEWSTVVDAPITYGLTEWELRDYIRAEYGRQGLLDLEGRLVRCREKGTSAHDEHSAEQVVAFNRAGPGGTCISLKEIIERYVHGPRRGEYPRYEG